MVVFRVVVCLAFIRSAFGRRSGWVSVRMYICDRAVERRGEERRGEGGMEDALGIFPHSVVYLFSVVHSMFA